ncbi:PEPTIDYL-PROLYL CIS-TRANS ISOMERASE G [Salix purpurea]|uniref:PEPTIDYL-PROLYL CIS-TRANS ISOMERASE G n=1 Tax=Salix purpurea TaxID=77065 RepID=A0A9Q0Q1T4_SALPP|nr:PEPTIDYL-PROLYL CIS-TRANS ISOMERASE G [Salix purpurea]
MARPWVVVFLLLLIGFTSQIEWKQQLGNEIEASPNISQKDHHHHHHHHQHSSKRQEVVKEKVFFFFFFLYLHFVFSVVLYVVLEPEKIIRETTVGI